jgi:hypothetical protein
MTEADIEREAERVVVAARASGTDVRLLGGLAIARHCPSAQNHPRLRRTYADIDLVARPKHRSEVGALLERLGYEADERFNNLHGHSRLLFFDVPRERQIDVFLGVFRMCHTLDLQDRFLEGYDCLPLADLVLTKLQIVELNEKDAKDVVTVFLDHDLADGEDDDIIDVAHIRRVCSAEWGFYTTVMDNLDKLREMSKGFLDAGEHAIVSDRVDRLASALDRSEKTLKWRMRNRIGRRVAWYELPEEVRDAPA